MKHVDFNVSEIKLNVVDFNKQAKFYQTVFGFKLDGDALVMNQGFKLVLTQVTKKVDNQMGLYHFAIKVEDQITLASFMQHLINLNIDFGSADHLVSKALYVDDPEGNVIEIYQDNPQNMWQYKNNQVVMATNILNRDNLLLDTFRFSKFTDKATIGHLHFYSNNLEQSKVDITQNLKMDLTLSITQAEFFSFNDYHHHFGVNNWDQKRIHPKDPTTAGATAITFKVDSDYYQYLKTAKLLNYVDYTGITFIFEKN